MTTLTPFSRHPRAPSPCHPREGGDPASSPTSGIPAFAGMTVSAGTVDQKILNEQTDSSTPKRRPGQRCWTPAQRAAAAARARLHRPWRHSTGPRTPAGKSASSQNAYRHGYRSAGFTAIHALLRRQRQYVRAIYDNHRLKMAANTRQNTLTISGDPLFNRAYSAKVTPDQKPNRTKGLP